MQHVGEKRGRGGDWVTGHFPLAVIFVLLWPDERNRPLPVL